MKTQTLELFLAAIEALEAKVVALEVAASGVPSAQAILDGVLAETGHAEAWADGTLSGDDRLAVLHEVRLAGRAWLRAKAQAVLDGLGEKALLGRAKAAVGTFFDHAKKYVREIVAAGLLVIAGPGPVTQQEAIAEAYEQQVKIQAEYLADFRKQIVAGDKPLDGTFVSRAEQYGNAAWGGTQTIVRAAATKTKVFNYERREHLGPRSKNDPCHVCDSQEKLGRQPIGTLKAIGDSPCLCSCHCTYFFSVTLDGPEYAVGRGPLFEPAFGTRALTPIVECVWDPILKTYVPCRDARGRFASCGGSGGQAKPKPGVKPAAGSGGGKKPRKPRAPKEPKPAKKPAAPNPPKEPKKPAEKKPPKEPKKPAEKKPPKEPRPPKEPKEPKPEKKPPAKKPATTPKPPEAPKPPAKKTDAEHHAEMTHRVDSEIDRLKGEMKTRKAEFDAANDAYEAARTERYAATNPTEAQIAAHESTKAAVREAHKKLEETAELGKRFKSWHEDVKANPNLIPPFPIQERLAIYAERGGATKVEALTKIAVVSHEARLDDIDIRTSQLSRDIKAHPKGSPERDKIVQEMDRLYSEKDKLIASPDAVYAENATAVAAAINPGKTLAVVPKYGDHAQINPKARPIEDFQRPTIDNGMAFVRQVTGAAGVRPMEVKFARTIPQETGVRGSYCVKEGIALKDSATSGTVVHEFGHHLENHTGAGHAARDFLAHRVGNETPQPLADVFPGSGYGPKEFGRKDKFEAAFGRDAWYVGKDYGKHGTEITSMALEKLHKDPAGLAKNDPELASFLCGVLDGSLR